MSPTDVLKSVDHAAAMNDRWLFLASLALLGASKGDSHIITADEVRTHHLSLINDKGNVVHEWIVRGGWIVEQ